MYTYLSIYVFCGAGGGGWGVGAVVLLGKRSNATRAYAGFRGKRLVFEGWAWGLGFRG